MVLGQIFCRFTGSAAQTHCARRPQLVSKKFLEEEIFAGTNFRELAFDRENRENFPLYGIPGSHTCNYESHYKFVTRQRNHVRIPSCSISTWSLSL